LSRSVIRELLRAAEEFTGERALGDGVTVAVDRQPSGTQVGIRVDGSPPEAAARLCIAAFGRVPDLVAADGTAYIALATSGFHTPRNVGHA
jgi:hypothetical protein